MKTKIFSALILILTLTACKFFGHHSSPVISELKYPMMDSADVFIFHKVTEWKATPDAEVYAHKLYLNAIDLFVNKKDVAASLPVFLLSMRISPYGYAAMKYGEALIAHGDYQAAHDMLSSASNLDVTILGQVRMIDARCYGFEHDTMGAYSALTFALENFPFDVKEVAADRAFEFIRDQEDFKILLAKYDRNNEERLKVLLGMFRKKFLHHTLPYELLPDSLNITDGDNIDFMYADIIEDLGGGTGRFSRSTEMSYQYMAELPVSGGYHTFIYRSVNYVTDSIPPVYYYVATVDTMGHNIARQEIGCYCSPVTLRSPSIDSAGVIEVREIAQSYRKDPLEAGYTHNEVSKQVVMATRYYQIQPDGKIESIPARPDGDAATAEIGHDVPRAPEVTNWVTK